MRANLNFTHPTTDLQASIDRFGGRAVLVPVSFPGEVNLDFVEECSGRAKPTTRFFFRSEASGLDEATAVAAKFRRRCRRTSHGSRAPASSG